MSGQGNEDPWHLIASLGNNIICSCNVRWGQVLKCASSKWMMSCRKKGKSEGFDSCDQPRNLIEIGFKSWIFSPCDLENCWMTSKYDRVPPLYYLKLCTSFQRHRWIQTVVTSGNAQFGPNRRFFVPYDLAILWITSKNNRAPLLYYIKLVHHFKTIGTAVTVRKRSIRVKIGDFLSHVTLKFDRWPWKTIGHLFYATSKFCVSFRSHWWLQTGVTVWKRPIWVKIDDFFLALKFDRWSWKTTWHLFFATSSFVHHFIAIGAF